MLKCILAAMCTLKAQLFILQHFPAVVRWHRCLSVIQWQLGGFRDKGTSLNKGRRGRKENILKADNVKIALTLLLCPLLGGLSARVIMVCSV